MTPRLHSTPRTPCPRGLPADIVDNKAQSSVLLVTGMFSSPLRLLWSVTMATPSCLMILLLFCLTVASSSDYDFYDDYSNNHKTPVEPLKTTPAPSIETPTIKTELFNNASFASALLAALNQMRAEQLQSDIRLHVNSSELPVHSLVLSAASPYFRKKFGGQTMQNDTLDVVLHGVLPDILENIINYIYTGQISLSDDNVELVMTAAKKFQLESVKELCGDYLADRLNATNCIKAFLIADNMECGKLRKAALSLTRSLFEQVISHDDIFHVSSDHLIEIISSDKLNVPGEKMPYQTIVKWLRKNPEEKPAFHKVLEHIRLPFLPAVFLHDRVSKHDVIKNSSECRTLVEEALWYHIMPPYRRKNMQTERTKPRPSYTTVGISPQRAITSGSDTSSLTVYNIISAQWQKQLELPHRMTGFAVARLNDTVYVAGGRHYTSRERVYAPQYYSHVEPAFKATSASELYAYSTTGERVQLAGMQKPRADFTLLAHDGCLYAIGGNDRSIERYMPSSNNWTFVNRIPY